MYIKWQYKWFGNKFLFFNSQSELTFWITLVGSRNLPGRSEGNLSHDSQCSSTNLNPPHHKCKSRGSLSIKEAIDSVGASQEEVTQAVMNSVWHMLCAEWIHDVHELASFPKIKVQKKTGFNEVHGSDMVETLEPHDEELTKDDMMKLEQQGYRRKR
jgi:hypothetical protein